MWVLEVGKIRSRLRFPRTIRLCVSCRQRRSRFRYRGIVKADADHNLCFKCFRVLQRQVAGSTSGGHISRVPTGSAILNTRGDAVTAAKRFTNRFGGSNLVRRSRSGI